MNLRPAISTICACAVLTVGYNSVNAPACTTTAAQKPAASAQRQNTNPNWWMGTPQSQMTTRMPSGQNPNDFTHTMTSFPTVYTQPVDKNSGTKVTLPVSTCSTKGIS